MDVFANTRRIRSENSYSLIQYKLLLSTIYLINKRNIDENQSTQTDNRIYIDQSATLFGKKKMPVKSHLISFFNP